VVSDYFIETMLRTVVYTLSKNNGQWNENGALDLVGFFDG